MRGASDERRRGRIWGYRAVAAALLLTVGACQDPPEVALQRPIDFNELAPGITRVVDDYVVFDSEPTTGRFACGLAIAKLDLHGEADQLVCAPLTAREQGLWTRALEGVRQIRGLYFLSPVDVKPDRPTTTRLCEAARLQGAELMLLYARNRFGPNAAKTLGVLYATRTASPVAVLHAERRFVDQEGLEIPPEEMEGDQRKLDARYQAQRAFEGLLMDCLAELIEQDRETPATQPHQWKTPPGQRWWLPHGR